MRYGFADFLNQVRVAISLFGYRTISVEPIVGDSYGRVVDLLAVDCFHHAGGRCLQIVTGEAGV